MRKPLRVWLFYWVPAFAGTTNIEFLHSLDCLIAQCAIENEVILLHNDKEFVQMAGVIPTLKQRYIGD